MSVSEVLVATAKPRIIASVRRQAHRSTIGSLIRTSGVWELMKARGIESTGHNVVVYWDEPGARLMGSAQGVAVDIGAEVTGPFEGDGELQCTATPGGRFISAVHTGPYDRLGEIYDALVGFARAHGLTLAGPYWEVYGHWTGDPAELDTTVSYAVA